ncbi:MAG: hypothetical protein ABIH23_05885 [bacterium]
MIALSNDPGLSGWGLCVWKNGWPVELKTLIPKGKEFDKILDLRERYIRVVSELEEKYGQFQRVAFESYIKWVNPKYGIARDLMTNCLATGVIVDVWLESLTPVFISKGTAPKEQASILTRRYFGDIIGSQHARDALLIGELAGFGRK